MEDDLETAWGILDSVRSVLEKEVKGEVVGLKLAGVFTSLAEVATESGRSHLLFLLNFQLTKVGMI